jgi:hypothetical protein
MIAKKMDPEAKSRNIFCYNKVFAGTQDECSTRINTEYEHASHEVNMFADIHIGKSLKALPAEALKAPIIALSEVDNSRILGEKLNHIKRSIMKFSSGKFIIFVVRV